MRKALRKAAATPVKTPIPTGAKLPKPDGKQYPSCWMRRVVRDWKQWTPQTRPQAGDFQIFHEGGDIFRLFMVLPSATDPKGYVVAGIRIKTGPKEEHAWWWDGNQEQPTLHPSVRQSDHSRKLELWHGFIEAGRMRSC